MAVRSTLVNDLEFEVCFPSEFGFEKIARDAVACFARRLGFSASQIDDLKTVTCEACVNAIEHGNHCLPEQIVQVRCCGRSGFLFVEIIDQGQFTIPLTFQAPSMSMKLQGLAAKRGMGIQIIGFLVDEFGFEPLPEGGTRFWFAMTKERINDDAGR